MPVTFEESLSGGQRAMTVTRRDHCRVCSGSGRTRAGTGPCHLCQGTGAVRSVRGHMIFSRSCGACSGTGHQRPRPCEPCAGIGQETRSETVTARIPPGVADGDRLRVPGKGNVGVGGGPAGDLYVTVKVGPASGVPARRRRSPHVGADRRARGRARRPRGNANAGRRRAACGFRPGRRPASASACEGTAPLRRGTGSAAISSWKCGSCCPGCWTSARRNCCGSSAGSTLSPCGSSDDGEAG